MLFFHLSESTALFTLSVSGKIDPHVISETQEAVVEIRTTDMARLIVRSHEGANVVTINRGEIQRVQKQFTCNISNLNLPGSWNTCIDGLLSNFDVFPETREVMVGMLFQVLKAGSTAIQMDRGQVKITIEVNEYISETYDETDPIGEAVLQTMALIRRTEFGGTASSGSSIQGLETRICREVDSEDCCAVCLNEFLVGSRLAKMPCNHIFHESCILQWLQRKDLCPLCRFQMSMS